MGYNNRANTILRGVSGLSSANKSRARTILEGFGTEFDKDGNIVKNLITPDGQNFGKVSYDAYKAVESASLDSYKPKNKEEENILSNFRQHNGYTFKSSDGKAVGNLTYDGYMAILKNNFDGYTAKNNAEKTALEAAKKMTTIPFQMEFDGEKKDFGQISYNAYKYYNDNGSFEGYNAVNESEKKSIQAFNSYAEEYAKKMREPESIGQGILHGLGYSVEKIGAGLADALLDVGDLGLAGVSKILSIPTWGSWEKALDDYAAERMTADTLGDVWSQSAEERYRIPDWYRNYLGGAFESVGAMIPALAAEYFTAGTSPMLESTMAKAAASTTAKTTLSGAVNTLKNSAKLIRPSDYIFGATATASAAKEGYKMSGDFGQALNYGILNGVGEVATEKLFGGLAGTKLGKRAATSGIGKAINQFADNHKVVGKFLDFGGEAIEEMLMTGADTVFQWATVNPDATFDAKQFGESALQGAFVSALTNGLITGPIGKVQRISSIKKLNAYADAANATIKNDALKFEMLPKDASLETIEKRRSELLDYTKTYTKALGIEIRENNTEEDIRKETARLKELRNTITGKSSGSGATISIGDIFKDTKTGNVVTVTGRDADNTSFEVNNGKKTMTGTFTNSQFQSAIEGGQIVKIADATTTESVIPDAAVTTESKPTSDAEYFIPANEVENLETSPIETTATDKNVDASGSNETVLDTDVTLRSVYDSLVGEKLSSSAVDKIISTPTLRTAFEQLTGQKIQGTKSEQRAIVRNFQNNAQNIADLKRKYNKNATNVIPAETQKNVPIADKTVVANETTPNAKETEESKGIADVVGVMKGMFKDGALDAIYKSMPPNVEKNLDTFAKSLIKAYNKHGNIGHIADYFSDGGKKVISAIESAMVTTEDATTTTKTSKKKSTEKGVERNVESQPEVLDRESKSDDEELRSEAPEKTERKGADRTDKQVGEDGDETLSESTESDRKESKDRSDSKETDGRIDSNVSESESVGEDSKIADKKVEPSAKKSGKKSSSTTGTKDAGRRGTVAYNTFESAVVGEYKKDGKSQSEAVAEALKQFKAYYDAGFDGVSFESVGETSNFILDVAYRQFYDAGVMDAYSARTVKNWGKDSGLKKDKIYRKALESGKINATLSEQLNALGKVMGIRIELKDSITASNGKKANARMVDELGVMWLSLSSTKPLSTVAIHEVVHNLRTTDAKSYNKLAKICMDVLGTSHPEWIKLKSRYDSLVEGQTEEFISDYVTEELVCDAVGEIASNSNLLNRLVQEDRNLVKKIWRGVKNLLEKVRAYIKKDANTTAEQKKSFSELESEMAKIERILYDALKARSNVDMQKFSENTSTIKRMAHLFGVRYNLAAVDSHKESLEKNYNSNQADVDLDTLTKAYNEVIDVWKDISKLLNSNFLKEWNEKKGTDRAFTLFKAQTGYNYNIELSTMCKKGIPLFEAIDTIVKKEVAKKLNVDTIGKAEKEILYDILKERGFDIPCAICYVEQARQREGAIINAFCDGKESDGKLGWNSTLKAIENKMNEYGVNYTFPSLDRSIATDNYTTDSIVMSEEEQNAFYEALVDLANDEIERTNETAKNKLKQITSTSPKAVNSVLKGNLNANLTIFKVLFNNPDSRFTIENDLLYSSTTTSNLAKSHQALYSLFNRQGGTAGYKTKQKPVVYWGDILQKKWLPSTLKAKGGIRSQSNSDTQMYTFLDEVQRYIDYSAKGYYSHEYTKVLAKLKLFGLSGGKLNASLIPKVRVIYTDGKVDIEKTMENAGLDKDGNLLFDGIEGINPEEAFMLIADPEYSKNIAGICIGYSDKHIEKLLDDSRIQLIIGFHDKTNNPDKRYYGARYAKNYNGENEATRKSDGKTVHIAFNDYVIKAEKMFKYNKSTKNYEGNTTFNGKEYTANDIPKLAADLYLADCDAKDLNPAYKQFSGHENYYKLLADFGLYDSQGNYSPHNKVVFKMPDTVPVLDENGKKSYVATKDYIQSKVSEEIKLMDSIAEAMADTSDDGIMAEFVKRVNSGTDEGRYSLSEEGNEKYEVINIPSGMYSTMETHFGTTKNFDVAGYLLIDGKMLDFSGKHWGDTTFTFRQVDHRDIQEVLEDSDNGVSSMVSMISNGNIRLMPETGGINLAKMPNGTQASVLRDYINHFKGEVIVDIDAVGGDTINSFTYTKGTSSTKILSDLEGYFNRGEIPSRTKSSVAEFRYNLSDEDSYAPTFYSQMGRTIDEMKQDKIGANSVISYLTGRGVKAEEIKWSGIEAFLDGKKSVTKAELQEFVAGSQLQIEETVMDGADATTLERDNHEPKDWVVMRGGKIHDTLAWSETEKVWVSDAYGFYFDSVPRIKSYYGVGEGGTRWGDYKLDGGENYREITFKMPDSDYTNQAMRTHWGEDAKGILAHARVQDFDDYGQKMLFIEEIQSDWHNEGHKEGYEQPLSPKAQKQVDKLNTQIEELRVKKDALDENQSDFRNQYRQLLDEIDVLGDKIQFIYESEGIPYSRFYTTEKVPDAPFRNNYHEYVLKNIIRMAAEQDYDSIGWTPSEIQSERWSEDYAEGYRIEYDQDIPKFLNKYGKKWGAKVGQTSIGNEQTVWSMPITDSMKESVLYEGQARYSLSEEENGDTKSSENLDIKINKDYSGNIRYSLANWRTDLNQAQYKEVEKWIRQAGNAEETRITDTANWYKGRINGDDLFVIYSTEDANPTILYEMKGANAKLEQNILLDLLEDEENGKSINGKPSFTQRVSKGSWMQNVNNSQNNLGNLGSGQNNQNAGVLQGQSQRNGSRAFWNVLENLFKRQEQNGSGNLNKGERYALADDGILDLEDLWAEAIEEYGTIPKGEIPARDIDVPKKISEKDFVSYHARTMLEAGVTPDDVVSEFEERIMDGTMTHERITNKSAEAWARKEIEELGFEDALKEWSSLSRRGKVGKKELALGMTLYNQCVTNKDVTNAMKIAAELVAEATNAGQTLQATQMLKRMSPDGQLYYLEKSIQKINEEFREKLGKKYKDIELDEDLVTDFLTTEDEEARDEVYDEICVNIAKQIPATLMDKWNSWRYLSMLGNPRTHMRNFVGNLTFVPATKISNAIEGMLQAKFIKQEDRTKSLKKDKVAVGFAKQDVETKEVKALLKGQNDKYAFTDDVMSKRKIFNTKLLEWARVKNFDKLELEDSIFLKRHYVSSLAQIITARGLDADNIDAQTLDEIRIRAVHDAKVATYRDANELAQMLNALKRSDKKTAKYLGAILEGIMPFKQTPLNIAKQGVNYSPVGLLIGTYKGLKRLKNGDAYSANDVIKSFSDGLTGTGMMLLGLFLSRLGVLVGGEDEDEKKSAFDELVGEQIYALKFGDHTYTIDWMLPSCLPLFVGKELHNLTQDEFSIADVGNAMSRLSEPLLELSVFSGISDAIEAANYSDSSPMEAVLYDALASYVTQAFPTLGGQISRIIDPQKREYYYRDKNSDVPILIQTLIGQAASKIPGASYLFAPSVDAWGRDEKYGDTTERVLENTLSPGYYSKTNYTNVDKELKRLYNATGNNEVLPVKQAKYFIVDDVRYDLSAEEYAEVLRVRGKKSTELLNALLGSEEKIKLLDKEKGKYKKKYYDEMSDSEKVRAINRCYEDAGEYAKATYMVKIYEEAVKSGDSTKQKKLDECKDILDGNK